MVGPVAILIGKLKLLLGEDLKTDTVIFPALVKAFIVLRKETLTISVEIAFILAACTANGPERIEVGR